MENTGAHCSDCTPSAQGGACASRAAGEGNSSTQLLECPGSKATSRAGLLIWDP